MKVLPCEDKKTLLDHFRIRGEVFIVEQKIAWQEEFDDWDYDATHFILYDGATPIGAARLFKNKVGRVAVLKEHRKKNAGRMLMDAAENQAKADGYDTVQLAAQTYIIPFYEKLGYTAYGEVFLDAGIEHRAMKKTV